MGLYRLGNDHFRCGHDHWSNWSFTNYILKLIEAVEFLDMPKLMTSILTIVGKEISELAAERMKKLGCSTVGFIEAPNGKLSIEGAGSSEDSDVAALAGFVSKLRDIQPELVDNGLASVLYKAQPNAALHLNHLIVKGGWNSDDAYRCVAAAETDRTGINVFGDEGLVAYSAEVAAASWEGIGKHSTAVPNLFFGVTVPKVLKKYMHPDLEISKAGQKITSDLIAWAVDAVLAAVPAAEDTDQFASVHTNAFLADGSINKVLASRVVPRDEVLIHHDAEYSWELRSEVVRVGLADALASFDAKTTAEQEAEFKAQTDLEDKYGVSLHNCGGVTSSRGIQTAVRRVFPGELAKHAVSEGVKAVTKFTSSECGGVSFKDGKVGYSRKLTAASDVDDVNSAISGAAGLQASVLETAHAMHARLSNPPSLTASVYLAATMEYLAAEILELSGNSARDNKSSWIKPQNVQRAVQNDEELNRMFRDVSILDGGVLPNIHGVLLPRLPRHGSGYTPSTDEAVATIDAFLNDEDQGSGYFVSGTLPCGFDKDKIDVMARKAGLGAGCGVRRRKKLHDALSAGAAWIVDAFDDERGCYTPRFTILSPEDQAALLQISRDEALVSTGAKRDWGNLQGNIQGITREMILALAARAGCLMLSGYVFEETRGILKVYLEDLIREVVTLADHKRRNVVFATDVLAAAASHAAIRMVCGTGRVAAMCANIGGGGGGGTPSAFATLAAEYSAKLARGHDADRKWAYPVVPSARDGDEGEYLDRLLDMCDEDGFDEAVTRAWTADLDVSTFEAVDERYDEDEFRGRARHASGMPYLTKEEIYADPKQVSGAALRYIRQMQRTSSPCLPFMPLTKLIREIAADFKTDLDFEPEAFRVIQSMLEDYLVGLFQDANLNCIHGGGSSHRTFPYTGYDPEDPQREKRSFAIQPKDLQLARRIRNERA